MNVPKKAIVTGVLLSVCVFIHFYSSDNVRVENGYSTNVYPVLGSTFRFLFGWVLFSIGDILWGIVVVIIARQLFFIIRFLAVKKRRILTIEKISLIGYSYFNALAVVYIFFNLFWGINYNREGIAKQLNLKIDTYSIRELKDINSLLVMKVNGAKQQLISNNKPYPDTKTLFVMTENAYKKLSEKYGFMLYKPRSLKASLWGWLGNYAGFLGYYNPATGEAQVNTTVPKFTQPFTACHEVAHQLGYAKEMEANFVGYLAAAASEDIVFHYSVYTDLFTYANRTLYYADSSAALEYRKLLLPAVISDFKERRKFNLDHTSFLEPIFSSIYSIFLRSNQQPMGMLSYDEVTGFIIAYYKKFGTI